jgi:Chaperone of endosialidase
MESNRMKTQKLASAIALSGLSATSLYAAQPPNPSSVLSDGFYNTAMGPLALSHVTPVPPGGRCVPFAFNPVQNPPMAGCANTASGFAALAQNTTGFSNTAIGAGVLYADTSGTYNTAIGTLAMFHNTTGFANSAMGNLTLFSNTNGQYNMATGNYALFSNTTGSGNAASGVSALYFNSIGSNNTGTGTNALTDNFNGNANTANGAYALNANNNGSYNVAVGAYALANNYSTAIGQGGTSSSYNVAVGYLALFNNLSALASAYNTAVGYYSLRNNAGINNTAVGSGALPGPSTASSTFLTGSGNTALGTNAGTGLVTGSFNTYVGYGETAVTSADNYVTQIGVFAQPAGGPAYTPKTFIAGISNSVITGAAVVVNANGQLGVLASSERYKTDIASLGTSSERLAKLRPVSFHLKSEPNGTVQYGLIAEEVDKVYPELVIRDKEGKIQGVRYDELAPMLLNEMQKQQSTIAAQTSEIHDLEAQNAETRKQLAELGDLKEELNAALRELKSKDSLVAQR